jgi:hypothetical protein
MGTHSCYQGLRQVKKRCVAPLPLGALLVFLTSKPIWSAHVATDLPKHWRPRVLKVMNVMNVMNSDE